MLGLGLSLQILSFLSAYFTSNAHRTWSAEPAVHHSTQNSPHGKVRSFFNQTSSVALKANAASLPVGAMVVKELFQADGVTLAGYAAMVKSAPANSLDARHSSESIFQPARAAILTPGIKTK